MSGHHWDISGQPVSREGVKVFPAVCSGCGEARDFPAHPERHNGVGKMHPTASECRGSNGHKTTAKSTKTVSEENEEGENMAHRPPLGGKQALERAEYWKKLWPDICADAVKLGATATKKKYGIPDGTWQRWRTHRPEFKALLNGHKAEPVKADVSKSDKMSQPPKPMPDDLKKADTAMDKTIRCDMAVSTILGLADEWETKAKVLRAAAGVLAEVA